MQIQSHYAISSGIEERLFELRTEITEKAVRQEEHTEIAASDHIDHHASDHIDHHVIEKKLEKIDARLDKKENNKNSDDLARLMM